MLLNLREYHRPAEAGEQDGLAHALDLLARPQVHTVPLAGGDCLNGSGDPTIEAVVDLQALGLTEISLAPNLGALQRPGHGDAGATCEPESIRRAAGFTFSEGLAAGDHRSRRSTLGRQCAAQPCHPRRRARHGGAQ